MASMTGRPVVLDPALLPPDRVRGYGLRSQAFVRDDAGPSEDLPPDERYAGRGVQHEVNNCGRLRCWSHSCDHTGDKFGEQHGQQWVTGAPFTVFATGPRCTGRHAIENARRRATERMEALEWTAVEWAVMTGACGASPYLVGPADSEGIELWIRPATPDGYTALAGWRVNDMSFTPQLPVGTDPVPVMTAIGALEWGARDYGGPGIIHAPSWSYPWFEDWEHREGARLVTQLGTGWAFGRGYPSVAPGTAQADMPGPDAPPDFESVWLYGTGAVRIWRSQPITTPSYADYDYRQNRSMFLIERAYTVTIQCPYTAVHVDLTQ